MRPGPLGLAARLSGLLVFGLLPACGAGTPPAATAPDLSVARTGPCEDFQLDVEKVWNVERKAELHAAFVSLGADYAEQAAVRVTTGMDQVTSDWVRLCQRLCQDHYVRNAMTAAEYKARSACFDAALVRQRMFVLMLSQPKAQYAEYALDAFEELSSKLEECQVRALASMPPAPDAFEDGHARLVTLGAEADLALRLHDPDRAARAALELSGLTEAGVTGDAASITATLAKARVARMRAALEPAWQMLSTAIAQAEHGITPWLRASAYHEAGQLWLERGEAAQAIAWYGRALALRKDLLGADDLLVARTLDALGAAYTANDDPHHAIALHDQALAIYRTHHATHDAAVADALNNLGMAYRRVGQPRVALRHYAQVLAIEPPTPHDDRVRLADTLHNQGDALRDLGQWGAAERSLVHALSIYTRALGPQHARLARPLRALGAVRMHAGDLPRAEADLRASLALAAHASGSDPGVADAHTDLGRILAGRHDYRSARSHFEQALAVRLADPHPVPAEVADSRSNLAMALQFTGDLRAAAAEMQRALAVYRVEQPVRPERELDALERLIDMHHRMHDCRAATRYLQEARGVALATLGGDHPRSRQLQRAVGCP